MDISNRIRNKMNALGLRSVDITKAADISKGTISQWLNGIAKPSGKNIIALAKVLQCDPEWLLDGKGQSDFGLPNVKRGPELQGLYPVISWVQAGDWAQIFEQNKQDAEHYPCPVKCSDSTFLLKVRGMSMSPTFNEDDLIFVDPEIEPSNGKYVVARLDDENEATFKQLIIEGGHKFLKAANPSWPTPIQPINGNCTIVGVVVFVGREL